MQTKFAAAAAAAIMFAAGAAQAATVHYAAQLKGPSEAPANTTTGTGAVDVTFDTASKAFTYTVTYAGLTGPATMAHFHGPAAPCATGALRLRPGPGRPHPACA